MDPSDSQEAARTPTSPSSPSAQTPLSPSPPPPSASGSRPGSGAIGPRASRGERTARAGNLAPVPLLASAAQPASASLTSAPEVASAGDTALMHTATALASGKTGPEAAGAAQVALLGSHLRATTTAEAADAEEAVVAAEEQLREGRAAGAMAVGLPAGQFLKAGGGGAQAEAESLGHQLSAEARTAREATDAAATSLGGAPGQQLEGLGAGGQADLGLGAPEALSVGGRVPAEGTKKSLGGFLRGALSGLAGVVAQAASAAGLEGLAESLAEAAEQRAVNFEEAIDAPADSVGGVAGGRSLSQRLRSGVKRSLSMSRRMRFGDSDEVDVVEGLHFSLTDRQRRLRAEAAQFAAESADPQEVRERDATGTFPREALAAAAGHGYGRMLIPKSQGGLGLGMDASCGIMEVLGGSDLPLAGLLAAHNAANYLLSTHGTSKIQEKLVRQMSSLSSLGALAISEAPGGSDIISTATCVEKDASGQFYTLNGSKAWVAGGTAADVLIVLVRTSVEPRKGLSLFALTKNMPGVSVGKPVALSGLRSCSVVPLTFNRVVVRTEYLIGREGQGWELLDEASSLLRTWLAAATVSYGETLLTSAAEAAAGGSILSGRCLERQANQVELVKARTQLQAARLLFRAAAQQLDCKAPTAACEASTAKIYAARAAQRAAETAVRLLGWGAVQSDQPCHAALRNLQAADFLGGPPDALYGMIFAELYRISAA